MGMKKERYKGRDLTRDRALSLLLNKRGVVLQQRSDGITSIDLSKAKDVIGNKTWGIIDYLRRDHKFVVSEYPDSSNFMAS